MNFKEALHKVLRTDKHTHDDPFLLYSRVCDLVGNNYEAKKAAEDFYRLDASYEISKAILGAVPKAKRTRRKRMVYKIQPPPLPPEHAYVFSTPNERTLHLSGECPCLKNKMVYRSFYDFARYMDYVNHTKQKNQRYQLSKHHRPPICHRCGSFQPTFARSLGDKIRAFLFHRFGIGSAEHRIYSPYGIW